MVMKNMAQRLLACILMCAVVTGALAVYASNPPSGDIPADMPGLAEWTERMPDAVHFQLITWRTNNALFAASLDDAAEAAPEEAWSVSSYVLAYDAQYNAIGSYYPPEDETDTPAMTTNEYDESGNLVRSVSYQDGQPYIETQTTYDSAGRIQTRTSWRQGEEIDRVVYDYTPQPDGTLVRRARSDPSGRVETDVINAAGQWLSSEWEGGSGSAAYDGQGRPTETVIETKTLSQGRNTPIKTRRTVPTPVWLRHIKTAHCINAPSNSLMRTASACPKHCIMPRARFSRTGQRYPSHREKARRKAGFLLPVLRTGGGKITPLHLCIAAVKRAQIERTKRDFWKFLQPTVIFYKEVAWICK